MKNKTYHHIEAPCNPALAGQGIFAPQGGAIYSNRSLTPQQATGNALAPGFNGEVRQKQK